MSYSNTDPHEREEYFREYYAERDRLRERDERLADEDCDDLRDVLIDIATTRIIEGSVQV